MKFVTLLMTFILTATPGAAYAAGEDGEDAGYASYCNEQAELAGIENAEEKSEYTQECMDNFVGQSGEDQPQDYPQD